MVDTWERGRMGVLNPEIPRHLVGRVLKQESRVKLRPVRKGKGDTPSPLVPHSSPFPTPSGPVVLPPSVPTGSTLV